MSLISSESEVVTKENLAEFYQAIYPYLGGYDKGKLTYVGEIRMFYSEIAPDGFLICDGSEYNKADYPELVNKLFSLTDTTPYVVDGNDTKFKVPDLRGEFLRGSGTNSHENQGNGANVGTHQDATDINDSSLMYNHYFTSSLTSKANADNVLRTSNPEWNISLTKDGSANGTVIHARPTNTSVLFCIAYKTIVVDIDFLSYGSEKFAKSDMYDTNERVVGKWIDGKPLYQKTYVISKNSSAKVTELLNISNLEKIYTITGAIRDTSNNTVDIGYYNNENVWINATTINLESTSSNGDYYITLQYTKTTDSVDSFKYSTPTDYSTEEKIIGTWIDGKPLYQKSFTNLSISLSNAASTAYATSSIDALLTNIKPIKCQICGVNGSYDTCEDACIRIMANNKWILYANNDMTINYLTIQYTKTTD